MNQALKCLQQDLPPVEAARRLSRGQGLSLRQAHRYVQRAREAAAPLAIPETKAVFTVKLPRSLVRQVRETARQRGGLISDWVARALRDALAAPSAHG